MSQDPSKSKPIKNEERKYTAALSYAVTMLLVGVPVWWKTTEVYRANLPYAEIDQLASLSSVQKVNILLITPDAAESHSRGPELQKILQNSEIYDVTLTVRVPQKHEQAAIEGAITLEEIDERLGKGLLNSLPGSLAVVEIPHKHFTEMPSVTAGNYRTVYFSSYVRSDELAGVIVDDILGEPDMIQMLSARTDGNTQRQQVDPMRKPSISEVDIYLTLLIPEPENVMASWDIEAATQLYLQPFLDRFPHQFRIRSQVLYLTGLNIPGTAEGSGPLQVAADQLGGAINSVESMLASQSSNSPALNFLLYIPPIHRTPLTIANSPTNSFLLPRWGGIIIYNYHLAGEDNFKFPAKISVDMAHVMGIWLGQLRTLLGVKERASLSLLPLPHSGLREWELDYQMRQRSLENILETNSTLSSLSQLISQIANIVIREEISLKVEAGVRDAVESASQLALGRLKEAFTLSQAALTNSEHAFFDPSLLALLYFPDDQKYAIYIPYFLPVGIPVLLSMRTVIRWIRQEKSKRD